MPYSPKHPSGSDSGSSSSGSSGGSGGGSGSGRHAHAHKPDMADTGLLSAIERAGKAEGSQPAACLGTLSSRPMTVRSGSLVHVRADGVLNFYGSDEDSKREALHFVDRVTRGHAITVHGSSTSELHRSRDGDLMDAYNLASSTCLLQRLAQHVDVEIPLWELLPTLAPLVEDAMLGSACMVGLALHWWEPDSGANDADDSSVMYDCMQFVRKGLEVASSQPEPLVGAHARAHADDAYYTFERLNPAGKGGACSTQAIGRRSIAAPPSTATSHRTWTQGASANARACRTQIASASRWRSSR
ncbi:hypothetical protein T492DRAFT_405830 [Pavlovales sp. CCMP2436]|nr:hypothetical protein T492DRAFT_405830 [Pavlovales sp. CCMP2436]